MARVDARIPVWSETRDRARELKRGGETWDQLLSKMVEQYDPDEPEASGP